MTRRTDPPAWQRFWTLGVPLALIALGTAIRLRQYVSGRSLWLDEAFLATSLTTRGPVELVTEPLAYSQSAPLGWLLAVRSAVAVGGTGEQALRLVPLLCGLATLVLTWLLAHRLLGPGRAPLPVALVALSPPLISYSNELKPYSADVAAVLLVVVLALRVPQAPSWRDARLWTLTAVGAVVVWFSTISLLAMAAVSVVLVLRALAATGLPAAVRTAVTLAPWTVPGLAVYVILTSLQKNSLLIDFWEPTFPQGAGDLPSWLGRTAQALADEPLRLSLHLLALALLAVGGAHLAWHERWAAALALAVVPAGVLAAAASAYPLSGRLALWLVPLVAVTLVAALPRRLSGVTLPWLVAAAVALGLVAGPMVRDGLDLVGERIVVQEIEPVLRELAERQQPGDVVLVDRSARAAFDLYAGDLGIEARGMIGFREPSPPCDDAKVLADSGFTSGRVWVVFTHQNGGTGVSRLSRAEIPRRAAVVADLQEVIEQPGAAAYLFTPRANPDPVLADDPSRCLVLEPR